MSVEILSPPYTLPADVAFTDVANVFTAVPQTIKITDSATNSITNLLILDHDSTGTVAAGFGASILWKLQSDTTTDRLIGEEQVTWATVTDASRKGRMILGVHDSATSAGSPREGIRIESTGTYAFIGINGAIDANLGHLITMNGTNNLGGFFYYAPSLNGSTDIFRADEGGTPITRMMVRIGGGNGDMRLTRNTSATQSFLSITQNNSSSGGGLFGWLAGSSVFGMYCTEGVVFMGSAGGSGGKCQIGSGNSGGGTPIQMTPKNQSSNGWAFDFDYNFYGQLKSSTTDLQNTSVLTQSWIDATHSTRTGRLTLSTYYTSTAQEAIRIDSTSTQALVGVGGAVDSTSKVFIQTGADATKGLLVKGNSATQSGNAIEVQASDGTILHGLGGSKGTASPPWYYHQDVSTNNYLNGLMFQPIGTNQPGGFGVVPSGTATTAAITLFDTKNADTAGTQGFGFGGGFSGAVANSWNFGCFVRSQTTTVSYPMNFNLSSGVGRFSVLNLDVGPFMTVVGKDTSTNAISIIQRIRHNTTGTAAAGFGSSFVFQLDSSTTPNQTAGEIDISWITATDASRASSLSFFSYYTSTAQEGLRITGDTGGVKIGLFGVTPAARPAAYTPANVTTDRSYDANATTLDEIADVLGTLISDLQSLGIIS